MPAQDAPIIPYDQFDRDADVTCPHCGWTGPAAGHVGVYDRLVDVTCPKCDEIVLIASFEDEYKS